MRDGSLARCQLSRLFRILMELQGGGFPNVTDLAATCGVSVRTIHRDLEALRMAGVPIQYRGDRLGYGLDRPFHAEPPPLERDEVLALVWLSLIGRGLAGRAVDARVRSALVKLVEGAGPAGRGDARLLLGLTPAAPGGEGDVRDGPSIRLIDALARGGPIRLRIRRGEGSSACTRLEPHRLESSGGAWLLVGRSSADRAVIRVRLDAIEDAEWLGEPSDVPARSRRVARRSRAAPG